MDFFAKIVNGSNPLITFAKDSIIDTQQGFKDAAEATRLKDSSKVRDRKRAEFRPLIQKFGLGFCDIFSREIWQFY